MCSLVHIEIFLKLKTLRATTNVTNPLFFLCVCVSMSFQGAFLNKFFPTNTTFKWLLACMRSDVSGQRPTACKFFEAIWEWAVMNFSICFSLPLPLTVPIDFSIGIDFAFNKNSGQGEELVIISASNCYIWTHSHTEWKVTSDPFSLPLITISGRKFVYRIEKNSASLEPYVRTTSRACCLLDDLNFCRISQ